MRLIDADALIEAVCGPCDRLGGRCDLSSWDACDAAQEIYKAKTINPDDLRPKGRWKRVISEHFVECSECGKQMYIHSIAYSFGNFCPNCGAKMEANHETAISV